MRKVQSYLVKLSLVIVLILPGISWARSSLELRLERLENVINNRIDLNLLAQIDTLQQEVQELRGKLEEQQHELALMNQKQDKLFLNLDTRINDMHNVKTAKATNQVANKPNELSYKLQL